MYPLTLTACNFLGLCASSSKSVKKSSFPVPLVSILGTHPLFTTYSDDISIRADASLPNMACVDGGRASSSMEFLWSETTGAYTGSLETKAPRVLNIDRHQLLPKMTYVFEVLARMVSEPNLNNTATLEVVVETQAVVAGIAGGVTTVVGMDSDLSMSASASVDPDGATDAWEYAWTCTDTATDAACTSASDGSVVALPSTEDVTIGSGELMVSTYEFGLFVRKVDSDGNNRNDTAAATVIMIAGDPPKVSIDTLDDKYNAVAGSFAELEGSVESSYDVTYAWSLIDADVAIASILTSAETRASVIVRAADLTAGATYTFRLTATDATGASGYAEALLVVNDNPSSGTLAVSPQVGVTMSTAYMFVALSWVDADLPLTYKYSYSVVEDGVDFDASTPLADEQASATLLGATLPMGSTDRIRYTLNGVDHFNNFTLVGQVMVFDAFRAYATAYDDFQCFKAEVCG